MNRIISELNARFSLFTKVLVLNSSIVALGAIAGTWTVLQISQTQKFTITHYLALLFLGVSISLIINYLLLRIAFAPLRQLNNTMAQVSQGELTARVEIEKAGPEVDQLVNSFNEMLDKLEDYRKSASSQVLRAMEDERKRIARELHDETSQLLTTLLLHQEMTLDFIKKNTKDGVLSMEDLPMVENNIKHCQTITLTSLEEIKKLTSELRPTILDDLGLEAAVRWLVKNTEPSGMKIDMQTAGLESRLTEDIEIVAFRIVQEALTNIIRHAQAKTVSIKLTNHKDKLAIHIEDDGKGFIKERVLKPKKPSEGGLGLFGMKERAELVSGVIDIDTAPNQGTRIQVLLPIK